MMEQIGSALAVLLTFVLILYGSYVCTKKVAKMSFRGGQSRYMKIEDRLMLSQDQNLTIVSVGEKRYLLGVTGGKISVLSELKDEELQEILPDGKSFASGVSFKDLITKLGKDKDLKL